MSRVLQVLRYFDYVFTGVFTFEMIIKVSGYTGSDCRKLYFCPRRLSEGFSNYCLSCLVLDDWPGSDSPRWLLLQRLVEHPGLHRRGGSAGGLRPLVSGLICLTEPHLNVFKSTVTSWLHAVIHWVSYAVNIDMCVPLSCLSSSVDGVPLGLTNRNVMG